MDALHIGLWLPRPDGDAVPTDCAKCGTAVGNCPPEREWLCDKCYAEEIAAAQSYADGLDMTEPNRRLHEMIAKHRGNELHCPSCGRIQQITSFGICDSCDRATEQPHL